jgi:hypothetical protein
MPCVEEKHINDSIASTTRPRDFIHDAMKSTTNVAKHTFPIMVDATANESRVVLRVHRIIDLHDVVPLASLTWLFLPRRP